LITQSHIVFDSYLGRKKPETIVKKENRCPFCDRSQLEEILDERGSIILVKNKYPVLKDTLQTVLIETDDCQSDLSQYSKDHLYQLLDFGITKWIQFMENGEFRSVAFFRNYGPLSGGTIAHPHSQIVGFYNYDINRNVHPSDFEGIVIDRNKDVEFNLSTKPRVGFYEFNVILHNDDSLETFADYIQIASHYVLNHFLYPCNSYNLFFYHIDKKMIVKIFPRFVTTPLYIGYSIPQIPNNLDEVVKEVQKRYFEQNC
jgi:hypothetical protein